MTELWKLSATEIADMVRRGDVSAVEVVKAHLDRIDQVNPKLNAVVQSFPEEALAAARAVDAKIAKGEDAGALGGVPFTTKVNVDQKGFATTNGLKLQKDVVDELRPRAERNLDVLFGDEAVDKAEVGAFLIGLLELVDKHRDGLVDDVAVALDATNEQ